MIVVSQAKSGIKNTWTSLRIEKSFAKEAVSALLMRLYSNFWTQSISKRSDLNRSCLILTPLKAFKRKDLYSLHQSWGGIKLLLPPQRTCRHWTSTKLK
jgi:hypothetical protein